MQTQMAFEFLPDFADVLRINFIGFYPIAVFYWQPCLLGPINRCDSFIRSRLGQCAKFFHNYTNLVIFPSCNRSEPSAYATKEFFSSCSIGNARIIPFCISSRSATFLSNSPNFNFLFLAIQRSANGSVSYSSAMNSSSLRACAFQTGLSSSSANISVCTASLTIPLPVLAKGSIANAVSSSSLRASLLAVLGIEGSACWVYCPSPCPDKFEIGLKP